ncbi:hypothetical protein SALBM311S_10490 [Streptomyces alboniger]
MYGEASRPETTEGGECREVHNHPALPYRCPGVLRLTGSAPRGTHPGGIRDRSGHPRARRARRPTFRHHAGPAERPRRTPAHPTPPRLEAGGPARRRGRGARRLVGRPRSTPNPSTSTGSTWPKARRRRAPNSCAPPPEQVELEMNLPPGWREDPALRAAAEARFTARHGTPDTSFWWNASCTGGPRSAGCPSGPDALNSGPNRTTGVFARRPAPHPLAGLALDAHALRAIEEGGSSTGPPRRNSTSSTGARRPGSGGRSRTPRRATRSASTSRRTTPRGHASASSESCPTNGASVGYAYDLLAECTPTSLVERGAEFVSAATDQGNFPMAGNFAKAGYPVVRERLNFHLEHTGCDQGRSGTDRRFGPSVSAGWRSDRQAGAATARVRRRRAVSRPPPGSR